MDINIHDTYIVMSHDLILKGLALYYTAVGLAYWGMIKYKYRYVKWMTIYHLICSIDIPILIWVVLTFDLFNPSANDLNQLRGLQMNIITVCIILFFTGQLIFFINLIRSMILGVRNKSRAGKSQ